MNPQLAAVIAQELPNLINLAREAFIKANPGAPVPTEAELKAQLHAALESSLATDADWLAKHPK